MVFSGHLIRFSISVSKKAKPHTHCSWNVARFLEWKRNNNEKSQTRLKMLDQIQKQDPDILCLEEFFHSPRFHFL
jgi:hypothetical protein